jgi:hypothetical protein
MTCTYDQATLDRVAAMKRWQLANLADCSADNEEAAEFLENIAADVVEAAGDVDPDDFAREYVDNYSGRAHEISNRAPCVYTATMWLQFVGTAAHREDITEYVDLTEFDFDKCARVALYIIAERLVNALVNAIADDITDIEEN